MADRPFGCAYFGFGKCPSLVDKIPLAVRADRFVERGQKFDQISQRQYEAGGMAVYKSTSLAMSDRKRRVDAIEGTPGWCQSSGPVTCLSS